MKKKISQIIAYSILGLVVVGFILCSILKLSFKPEMVMPAKGADAIQISVAGQARYESLYEEEKYNEFLSEYEECFKLTILNSLFSGNIGKEVEINKETKEPSFDGYKVVFVYNQKNTLKKDGKEIMAANNSSTAITYNRVAFEVRDAQGFGKVDIYFYNNGETNFYRITTLANFDELYNHISEMEMFGE